MLIKRLLKSTVLLTTLLLSCASSATWYESSGQAVINNGNIQQARQAATQEAIKQALLFAGASISSVQRLTNGLLQDDSLEIRSSGDVENIEMIDERYDGDILTISIRADIFPQAINCRAADYQKSIVTAWYPIKHKQQAVVGQLFNFGQQVAARLQKQFNQQAQSSVITKIEPFYLSLKNRGATAIELAKKTNSQYVLIGEIVEFSTIENASSSLAFWQSTSYSRDFSLSLTVYDGNTGDPVFNKEKSMTASWDFNTHQVIDANSSQLWQSEFGLQVMSMLQTFSHEIDSSLSCIPAYGRVLFVNNDQININLGQQNGIQKGDRLTLYQMNQFFDTSGNLHQQYRLHPEPVVVKQVFTDSAVIASQSGAPLSNIQANDFVARR
jgi:hypothetical protein